MADRSDLLAKVRELITKATPGHWQADLHHTRTYAGRTYAMVMFGGVVPLAGVVLGVEGMSDDDGRANAVLMSLSRTMADALLEQEAEIAALRADRDRLREALTVAEEYISGKQLVWSWVMEIVRGALAGKPGEQP